MNKPQRACVICGAVFDLVGRGRHSKISCSPECVRENLRRRAAHHRKSPEERARRAAWVRADRAANPEKFRLRDQAKRKRELESDDPSLIRARKFRSWNKHLKRTYGIDFEDWARMFHAQRGACAGCLEPLGANDVRIHVDHDHTNGRLRGMLCHNCNCTIGYARDSIPRLRGLIAYLERSC